jgi:hypothetical protein
MKRSQLREIIRNVIKEEKISKGFAKAAESYQAETLALQKLQEKQAELVKKFKSSSADTKESLKTDLIKLHRQVKAQQDKVDMAETLFSRAIMLEPVEFDD